MFGPRKISDIIAPLAKMRDQLMAAMEFHAVQAEEKTKQIVQHQGEYDYASNLTKQFNVLLGNKPDA